MLGITYLCHTTPFRKVYRNRAKQLFSALLALAAERSKASGDFPKRRLLYLSLLYNIYKSTFKQKKVQFFYILFMYFSSYTC